MTEGVDSAPGIQKGQGLWINRDRPGGNWAQMVHNLPSLLNYAAFPPHHSDQHDKTFVMGNIMISLLLLCSTVSKDLTPQATKHTNHMMQLWFLCA